MKLTTILLLSFSLQISAKVFSQTITYSARAVELKDVFGVIRQQTGYVVFYDQDWIDPMKRVDIFAKEQPLEAFLHQLFIGLPLGFTIERKAIIITRKSSWHSNAGVPAFQPPAEEEDDAVHHLIGKVQSAGGEPLAGATIRLKRTNAVIATDGEGRFEMDVNRGDVLVVSYTGYQQQEIRISRETSLTITMVLSESKLDEVQIVAYGQNTQRFNVGNVTTVKSEDIRKAPVTNVLQALAGRIPGVIITQSTGYAGTGMTVQIEGQNSIRKGNNPFYVVDGVPYMNTMPPNLGNITGGSSVNYDGSGAGNRLNYINPADIESITVLKDADATAIYGSRAANGAIIITTKRGSAGPMRVDLGLRQGLSIPQRNMKQLSTTQFLEMRHEALRNDGKQIGPNDWDLNGRWDTTRSMDWQKALLGNHAGYTEGNLSVSGGSANSRYVVGATFNRTTTLVPVKGLSDRRGSVHFAQNIASNDQRFKMDVSLQYMYDYNILPQGDNTVLATQLPPVTPELYNPDGSLNWFLDANGASTWNNPLAVYMSQQTIVGRNLTSSLNLSYQLLRGLTVSTRLGYSDFRMDEKIKMPLSTLPPQDLPYASRTTRFGTSSNTQINIEPQFQFNRAIGAGALDVTGGFTINENRVRSNSVTARGFATDAAMDDITSAKIWEQEPSAISLYRLNGGFGRINYIHARRYILTVTGRRDGTSRFGPDNLFHNFGSVAGGWIFSEESFFKRLAKTISFGKLTASYGTTGSDQIGNYMYMDLYSPVSATRPYQGGIVITPLQLTNPKLQWESTKKFNTALSLGFFKQKLTFEIDYYRNESGNQLLSSPLANPTGFNTILINRAATVRNYGYDLIVGTDNIRLGDFSWSGRIMLSIARNRLVRYDGLEESYDRDQLFIGKPLNFTRVYRYQGVDPQTGLYTFLDNTGKPTSKPNYSTDRTIFLDLNPSLYGSTEHTFTYKGVSLSMLWMFQIKKGTASGWGAGMPGWMWSNQPLDVLKRWQKPGDIAPVQRYSTNNPDAQAAFSAYRESDANFQDASFVRLKNLSFSWRLPAGWMKSVHFKDFEIFGNAQNLLTITRFPKGDPETLNYWLMPAFRTFAFGFRAGL